MDKSLSDRMRIAVIGTPLAEVKIWAEEVFTLENEIKTLELRLQGLVCETCGTNSWIPAVEGEQYGIPDGNGDYMLCAYCELARHRDHLMMALNVTPEAAPPSGTHSKEYFGVPAKGFPTLEEYEKIIDTLAKHPGSPIFPMGPVERAGFMKPRTIYPGDPGEGFKEVDPDAYRGGT